MKEIIDDKMHLKFKKTDFVFVLFAMIAIVSFLCGINFLRPLNVARAQDEVSVSFMSDDETLGSVSQSSATFESGVQYAVLNDNVYNLCFADQNETIVSAICAQSDDFDSAFLGWYTRDGSVYTPIETGTIFTLSANTTFVAKFEQREKSYKITYDLGGGEATNADRYTASTPSFSLNAPTRDGYIFLGWTGSNLTEAQTDVTISQGTTGDLHFVANWQAITYGIVFHKNVSALQGEMEGLTNCIFGEAVTLPTCQYSLQNCKFMGWAYSAVGEPQFEDGAEFTLQSTASIDSDGNVNLYAIFKGVINVVVEYSDHSADLNREFLYELETTVDEKLYKFDSLIVSDEILSSYSLQILGNYVSDDGETLELLCANYYLNISPNYSFDKWSQTGNTFTANVQKLITVTYGPGEATGNLTSQSYPVGYSLALPACQYVHSDSTLHFAGWLCEQDGKVYQEGEIFEVTTAVKFVAQWQSNIFYVVFDSNKPETSTSQIEGSMANQLFKSGESQKLSKNCYTQSGYVFVAWNWSKTGEYANIDDESMFSYSGAEDGGTITLYAVWRPVAYTVTFNSNQPASASTIVSGEMQAQNFEYDDGQALSKNGFSLVGYTFLGWAKSAQGNIEFEDEYSLGNLTQQDGDQLEFFAIWRPNVYSIVYNANVPATASSTLQGSMPNQNIQYDSPATTLNKNNFVLDGYTFLGWAETPGGEVVHVDCDSLPANMTTEDGKKYYYFAVWHANEFVVQFDSNKPEGASSQMLGQMESQQFVYDVAQSLSKNNFTLEGYTFLGWSKTADGTAEVLDNASTKNLTNKEETITLFAVWRANQYTISFNCDLPGIVGTSTQQVVSFDEQVNLDKNTFSKKNYKFFGWATESCGEVVYQDEQLVQNITSVDGQTINLFAVFKLALVLESDGNGTITNGGTSYFDAQMKVGTIGYYLQRVTTNVDSAEQTLKIIVYYYGSDGSNQTKSMLSIATPNASEGFSFTAWRQSEKQIEADVFALLFTATFNVYVNVSYVANDGTSKQDDLRVIYGTTITLRECSFEFVEHNFEGWQCDLDGQIYQPGTEFAITSNVKFVATWTVNKYTVVWQNYDGTELYSELVEYGSKPNYVGSEPTRPSENQYNFIFNGWNPTIDDSTIVSGNITYVAVFKQVLKTFVVTWKNGDGTVLETDGAVPYGTTPSYDSATPTMPETEQYEYTFTGWSPAISSDFVVTNDITFVAQYSTVTKQYTIKWQDDIGNILYQNTFDYGATPQFVGETPTKAQDEQWVYTFDRWSPQITSVTKDMTYTAVFARVLREYTVIWKNGTETLKTQIYHYSDVPNYSQTEPEIALPSKPSDAQYDYIFEGWTPSIEPVTKDVTYYASFAESIKSYNITWQYESGEVLFEEMFEYGSMPEYHGETPVKAMTERNIFQFSHWTPAVEMVTAEATYTAQFSSTTRYYQITWNNDDGTTIQLENYEYEETPTYTGKLPTKEPTAQYSFAFDKWTPTIVKVTDNATYTASYTSTTNSYTITWKNWDGTVLEQYKLNYGETPTFKKVAPTKPKDAQYTYSFAGWEPEVIAVEGDATYTAQFDSTINSYTITWKNWDGEILLSEQVEYGKIPLYSGESPTKPEDDGHTYTFANKWSPTVTAVNKDATYTAVFNTNTKTFVITWNNWDGTELRTDTLPYGSTPNYQGVTPSRTATAEFAYTFEGWDKQLVPVSADETYTAVFSQSKRAYTIIFKNFDGNVLQTSTVSYGEMPAYTGATPSRASTTKFSYTFSSWTPQIESVTGDATYVAVFDETINKYSYTINVVSNVVELPTIVLTINGEQFTLNADNQTWQSNFDYETLISSTASIAQDLSNYNLSWTGATTLRTTQATKDDFKLYKNEVGTLYISQIFAVNAVVQSGSYSSHANITTQTTQDVLCGGSTSQFKVAVDGGYKFVEWQVDGSCSQSASGTSISVNNVTSNVTISAKIDIVTYYLTIDINGTLHQFPYTVEDESFSVQNLIDDGALEVPTREGYNFVGWIVEGSGIPQSDFSIQQGSTGNKRIVARWEAIAPEPEPKQEADMTTVIVIVAVAVAVAIAIVVVIVVVKNKKRKPPKHFDDDANLGGGTPSPAKFNSPKAPTPPNLSRPTHLQTPKPQTAQTPTNAKIPTPPNVMAKTGSNTAGSQPIGKLSTQISSGIKTISIKQINTKK